jgi:hypothetical protein
MHELFHLELPLSGFVLLHANSFTPSHAQPLTYVDDIIGRVLNVVQHDQFVLDFVAAGLPLSEFMGKRDGVANYKAEARSYRGKQIVRGLEWWPWSWWSYEYFNNYISIKHGDADARDDAIEAEKWGARALPRFERTAAGIRQWVNAGKHRDAATYQDALRQLMTLLHLPPVKAFSSLSYVAGSAPQVKIAA